VDGGENVLFNQLFGKEVIAVEIRPITYYSKSIHGNVYGFLKV
jgi:hypothetical protein